MRRNHRAIRYDPKRYVRCTSATTEIGCDSIRRLIPIFLILGLLCGCTNQNSEMSKAISMREELNSAKKYSFDAKIVADYGEFIYTFDLNCQSNENSGIDFTVISPDSISGLKGNISSSGGKLTFHDEILSFPVLAEGQITPVSAPWILIHTLKSGYIQACGKDQNGYILSIDDSYQDNALRLDIHTDENMYPLQADILWQGKRILALSISNYQIS